MPLAWTAFAMPAFLAVQATRLAQCDRAPRPRLIEDEAGAAAMRDALAGVASVTLSASPPVRRTTGGVP
jgi:hypothetical protein